MQQRHIASVAELMRLFAVVCSTQQHSSERMMHQLEVVMGQLLGAGCSHDSRNTLISMLLKQVRNRAVLRSWG